MTKINQVALAKCPVDFAFQRIGGKYKARVLWFLRDGIKRYGELRRFVIGITPKMLTQVLRELEELSYKEISTIVGIPMGTVMSRLARGRQQLAELLAPPSPDQSLCLACSRCRIDTADHPAERLLPRALE